MKSIGEMNITLRGKGDQRNEIFEYFFERLYGPWLEFKKQKPTPANKKVFQKFLALKISHMETFDLIGYKGMCIDAEKRGAVFGKFFYGNLKMKKDVTVEKLNI